MKLKDLSEEAWIGTTDACSCGALVRNHCIRNGFEPQITFESDDYLAIQGLVAAGVGVAMIPTLALTTVRDDIIIRDLGSEAPVRDDRRGDPAGRAALTGGAGDARRAQSKWPRRTRSRSRTSQQSLPKDGTRFRL